MDPSYNNPFNGSTPNGMGGAGVPISSGEGDIILAGGGEKKSNRLIVVVIALAVVAAMLGVLVFLVMRPGGSSAPINNARGEYKAEFNKFANYVISGEEKTTPIDVKSDSSYDYYFMEQMSLPYSAEKRQALVGKARSLFNEFVGAYGDYSSDNGIDGVGSSGDTEGANEGVAITDAEILNEIIAETKDMLDFMVVVSQKPPITGEDLATIYLRDGREATLQAVDGYFDFGDMNSFFVRDFSSAFEDSATLYADVLDKYSSNGCLIDRVASYECLQGVLEASELEEFDEMALDLAIAVDAIESYYDMSYDLVLKVYMMDELINNSGLHEDFMEGDDE